MQSLEAEEAVLGGCLLRGTLVESFVDALRPDHFTHPDHREVWEAILIVYGRGEPVDAITVAAELERRGRLVAPIKPFVHTLVSVVAVPSSAAYYARIVAEHARQRAILEAAHRVKEAADNGTSADELLELWGQELHSLSSQGAEARERLFPGGSFALDAPDEVPGNWGTQGEIGWAQGEPFLIVGPSGIGKTTFMQRITLARIGVGPAEVLGYPVQLTDRPVLYVAADRPLQAARSLRRMIGEVDRDRLDEMVLVWKGSLPFDIGREPDRLARWAERLGVGTIVIDSLKDVAVDLAQDETGSRVARAFQQVMGAGIELMVSHHQRKAQGDNRKPKNLDDVYGSTFITGTAGSVLLLWGRPGDPVLELVHLKSPAGEVGPLQLLIEHDLGSIEILQGSDVLSLVRDAPRGLTVRDAARRLFGSSEPTRAEELRAWRKLNDLANKNLVYRKEGDVGQSGARREPDLYFATPPQASLA